MNMSAPHEKLWTRKLGNIINIGLIDIKKTGGVWTKWFRWFSKELVLVDMVKHINIWKKRLIDKL